MGKRKKNKSNTPRHKRMNRPSRLQAAKHWIPKYDGKNLVKGYSKHFAVDHLCAVAELKILGYSISEKYKSKLKEVQIQKQKATELRKAAKKREQEEKEWLESDSDETFAFIAGYTEGGVPFGLTWDEWGEHEGDKLHKSNSTSQGDTTKNQSVKDISDETLPF